MRPSEDDSSLGPSAQNRVDEHRKHAEPWERGILSARLEEGHSQRSPGRGGFSAFTWERGTDLAQTGSSGLPEMENTYFRYSLLPSAVFFFYTVYSISGARSTVVKESVATMRPLTVTF